MRGSEVGKGGIVSVGEKRTSYGYCTGSIRNIKGIAKFLSPMKNDLKVELLRYHEMGVHKWRALGREYTLSYICPPGEVEMSLLAETLKKEGLKVIKT